MKTLTLWLQKSSNEADVSELSTIVSHVVQKLKYLVSRDPGEKFRFKDSVLAQLKFNSEFFEAKLETVRDLVETLPAASRLRSCSEYSSKMYDDFAENIYKQFVSEVADVIESKLTQLHKFLGVKTNFQLNHKTWICLENSCETLW